MSGTHEPPPVTGAPPATAEGHPAAADAPSPPPATAMAGAGVEDTVPRWGTPPTRLASRSWTRHCARGHS
jgi:hypothetical protein